MKLYSFFFVLCSVVCFGQQPQPALSPSGLNKIAESYVRLGLAIGQYDTDFVDAYYGPDSLKPVAAKQAVFPKDKFLRQADNLIRQLAPFTRETTNASVGNRAEWIRFQLIATKRRIRIFSGEYASFDTEAKELMGIQPPSFTEEYFRGLLTQLDELLPGEGNMNDRFQRLANQFIIPKEKLDTVYKTAIAESRRRTLLHFEIPQTENFRLEFVTGKPWSGYNWYQGNYTSVIQINTDITASIEKAIDLASHEGYPGHHVFNSLLEKHLYRDKGWIEISLYPLFSPQSLLAEGSANFGIEMAFPGNEKNRFTKDVLLPLAGLDTTGLSLYYEALQIRGKLQYVHTEITRRLVSGKMTDQQAVQWTMDYGLFNEKDAVRALAFKKKYRSYVINYTIGQDLVRNYIASKGGTESHLQKRWETFKWLLSNEVITRDLIINGKP